MDQTHQQEAAIFDAAMELPPEKRAAHLEHACGGDAALRQRIESLLKACESSCEFLDSPVDRGAAEATNVSPRSFEKAGDRIGRYKLLQQIGEGGCGVVYMAEQEEPVSRRVALKVIKLGLDTKSVIARFEAERQALALMDHPNIAKVLDAGATETGRPYFVMELVRGLKITEYCDEARLSTKARLDLFIQVCQAIQHAHQKGIIHRDIKPSNILVTINDGAPLPKVIDFGIAKATSGQKLTNKTVFTAFEQFIGTPAYMSPEQAVFTSLDIDTRSDIYALGVLLYEMLTGRTPFDAKELLAIGLDEMRRTIREQEPPRPSARLSTLSGQELSTTAQRRSIEAPKLVSELRGDLDWIVMKALEKDRARRYETANGLVADLQRHLHNEPVVACPPTAAYRFQKMVRRNKLAFAAGSAVGVSLVVGLTLSTILFFRERAARNLANEQAARANEQAAIAQAVSAFLQKDLLGQASTYSQAQSGFKPDPNLTVREALERGAQRIGDRFKNHALEESAVRFAIGNALCGVGEAERAIPHLQRSLELARANWGPNHRNTLESMNSLAVAYYRSGKIEQALPIYEETLKLERSSLEPGDFDIVNTMNNLAMAYRAAGKLDQALPLYEEALRLSKTSHGPERRETLNAMNNLGNAYRSAGRIDQALPLLEQTLKLMRARLRTDDPFTQNAMVNLALIYHGAGKLDQALPLFEEALKLRRASLGSDDPETPGIIVNLATAYHDTGKFDQALPLWEEALKLTKARFGPDATNTLAAMENLAIGYKESGKIEQALPLFQDTLKLTKTKLAPDDLRTLKLMHGLAGTFAIMKNFAEAETLYRDALNQFRPASSNAPPREVPLLGSILLDLADLLRKRNMLSEARTFAEEAMTLYHRHADWPADQRRHALEVLALAYSDSGKYEQALPLWQETLKLTKAKFGPDDVDTLTFMSNLAGTFANLNNYSEAEPVYRDALNQLRSPSSDAPPREVPILGAILHGLADVLRNLKRPGEARPFAEEALALYDRHTDWPAEERRHTLEVLEAVLKDLGDSRELKAVRFKRAEAGRAAAEQGGVEASNNLAWLLATCSDSAVRDGRSAVRFAEKAVAKTARKDPAILDTLAAAYAEAGEFAKAANVQNEAIALFQDEKMKKDCESRLKLYQSNTPYHEP